MRGKESGYDFYNSLIRITPAYAGKSDSCRVCVFDVEDHPRLCGEKRLAGADFCRVMGSPPPMRGKGF